MRDDHRLEATDDEMPSPVRDGAGAGRHRPRRMTRALAAIGLVATGAVVGGGVAVAAVGSFSDVPDTHPFFHEIEWMADAGISEGYADGTFKPNAPVTRQAMSAFMARLAQVTSSRASLYQAANVSTMSASFVNVATLSVPPPAGMDAQLRVVLNAEGSCVEGDGALDPASCEVRLLVNGVDTFPGARTLTYASHGDPELVTAVWMVPVSSPEIHDLAVQVRQDAADGENDTTATLTDVLVTAEFLSGPAIG